MFGWMIVSALVCIACAVLGFSSLLTLTPVAQGLVLLVMTGSAIFLLGAFEAHESSRRDDA